MKIIAVSNLNDETQSDRLVAENIKSNHEIQLMVNMLNTVEDCYSRDFYKAVPDDYKLYTWEP